MRPQTTKGGPAGSSYARKSSAYLCVSFGAIPKLTNTAARPILLGCIIVGCNKYDTDLQLLWRPNTRALAVREGRKLCACFQLVLVRQVRYHTLNAGMGAVYALQAAKIAAALS